MKKITWNREEMTPLARAKAMAAGQAYDRIPSKPSLGEQPTRLLGIKLREYFKEPHLMAAAQIEGFLCYGQDGVGVGPDQFALPEALGANLIYGEDALPQMGEPLLRNYQDLKNLKLIQPLKDGRLGVFIEALELIREQIGHLVGVGSGIGGPFTAAAFLRGTANLLRDLRKNPEFVHALLHQLTENIILYIEECHKRGFSCSIGEPLASNTILSVDNFRVFVKPYLTRIGAKIKADTNKNYSLHICGKTAKLWQDMAETGAGSISLDNMEDLARAKASIGDKVSLCGNVPPVDIMLNGSKEEVFAGVKKCLEQAKDNPKGYVVGTGCRVPLETPKENIIAFMDAVRLYGRAKSYLEIR